MKTAEETTRRICADIDGVVQGVGFRPFVYNLAGRLGLAGDVRNTAAGVTVCLEGNRENIDLFLRKLKTDAPPHARITAVHIVEHTPIGSERFEIIESAPAGTQARTLVLPDLATCDACLAEMHDPDDRRFSYPFINCTHCGPRYSIIGHVPYDRPNTTMAEFEMCEACRREYEDPADRRFHAQPIACPHCGPTIELWDSDGNATGADTTGTNVIEEAGRILADGRILAVKGLGGFHLLCDGENREAVERLRRRKHRSEKPFALMYPDEERIRRDAFVNEEEAAMLHSAEAPIVILDRRSSCRVADSVHSGTGYSATGYSGTGYSGAGGEATIGIMLPYTPLHHLLLEAFPAPVIATSGNISEEPLCIDEYEALSKLSGIADRFLVHNRPIERAVDDSIVRYMDGRMRVLRRARGFAPLPVNVRAAQVDGGHGGPGDHGPDRGDHGFHDSRGDQGGHGDPRHGDGEVGRRAILAVGAHLKNTVAVAPQTAGEAGEARGAGDVGDAGGTIPVFLSQHLGDLETESSYRAFVHTSGALTELFRLEPSAVACDLHPDYASSRYAEETGLPLHRVQHHFAHVLSVMAEHGLVGPVAGVAWDGVGLGDDGGIWGGEFLECTTSGYHRFGTITPFRLPGGDQAAREPRRSALGMMQACDFDMDAGLGSRDSEPAVADGVPKALRSALTRGINAPFTTSVGRLFDGFASILDIAQFNSYEGQAAVMLEQCAMRSHSGLHYNIDIYEKQSYCECDWRQAFSKVIADYKAGSDVSRIARGIHVALAESIRAVVSRSGLADVVLAGGCFQNRLLTEETAERLRRDGMRVWLAQHVPPNDGGIALGQAYYLLHR